MATTQNVRTAQRIAVVGAGAIGGYLAVRLANAGHCVSVVQRGQTLQAIRDRGMVLHEGGTTLVAHVPAAARCGDLDKQDIVFLTVKATGLRAVAPDLALLLAPHTRIVPVLNGIPWWYSRDALPILDPDNGIANAIPHARIIGCVAHVSAQMAEPGVVRCIAPGKLVLGEPGGGLSQALHDAASLLAQAGIAVCASDDIRQEIWTKLIGNLAFNPISALTGARMDEIFASPELIGLARQVMLEGMAIGQATGIHFPVDVDRRLDMARAIGAAKLSMLQDLEAGRALEVDAIVTAVVKLAAQHRIAAPTLKTVHALIKERARHLLY
ncbi:ketopantoate reductase family protein [Noviherbaspirillum saxi]|uniref:2-dehydropantoate 2-reductase n=1 Tax=Noviherbaspirillum saxi TaxID=2320863 RepID=A0A3A3FIX1_9BURK|nr:2-dehydropantoate 2-reductase [Noviherbaspirillum saxi]RJF95204.1 2-dehydropantoate 2-reductase [Noviherbaspirillum saxi]